MSAPKHTVLALGARVSKSSSETLRSRVAFVCGKPDPLFLLEALARLMDTAINGLDKADGMTSDPFAQIRQDITGMDYSTEFMVKLFIQDLRLLIKLGYELPEWASENDIKVVEQYLDRWKMKHDPQ